MSLDKFLKKSKSSKKTTAISDNKPVIKEENAIEEVVNSIEENELKVDKKESLINQENNINISYEDLLAIIKQIPSYSVFLTEVIWILEDSNLKNIEEYLKKQYELSDIFIKVLLKEARKVLSEIIID